jgi:predicted transcriptional regulator
MLLMAMTLRLTDDEQAALRQRADDEGMSMQDVARRAIRDYIDRGQHRDRVVSAGRRIIEAHADALDRLGQ